MGTTLGVIAFVVLILFAIGFHEFGHYITARWAGIKVSKFFIGFGPTLWSYRRGRPEVVEQDGQLVERPETEYGVKLLPLGGFVKVLGMSPFEDIPPEDQPRAFGAAPAWKRAIVLAAGSVTHFITAFVCLVIVLGVIGMPDPDRPTLQIQEITTQLEVDGESVGAPAYEAGLRPGDRVVAVNGRQVAEWDAFRDAVRANPATPVRLRVEKADGTLETITVVPVPVDEQGETIGVIGAVPAREIVRVGPATAVGRSAVAMKDLTVAIVQLTPRALSPQNIIGDPAARGEFAFFLLFFVNINVFIALLNLLPLPPLDGGHLLVLGIEKIRRKPIDPRALLPITAVVFSLLVLLGVFLIFRDIVSPFDPFQ